MVGRKPAAPGPIIAKHRAEQSFAGLVSPVKVFYNAKGLRSFRVARALAVFAYLARPGDVLRFTDSPGGPHNHGTVFAKLHPVAHLGRFQPDLVWENDATAIGKCRIRRLHQPHPQANGQPVQHARLARSVIADQQCKALIELERLLRELLEVLNLQPVNSHVRLQLGKNGRSGEI